MEPITREEYYLAKIAGTYEGKTPEPVTIEEYYLATMAGDYSGNTPQPVTRLQYYMAKVAGVWGGSIPAPVTRLEYYWAAIASGEGKVFPPVTREEHFLVLVADAYSVVLTVVTGNPALLESAKGNRGLESLTLYGKSTQGSTTGANLLPCAEEEVVTEKRKYTFKNPLPAGEYALSIQSANREPSNNNFVVTIEYTNGAYGYASLGFKTKNTIIRTKNEILSILIYSDNSYNDSLGKTTIFTGLMFNAGSAAIPYEPYTGGAPSPSPSYPQEIENAGQSGEIGVQVYGGNLFDISKATPWEDAYGLTMSIDGEYVTIKGVVTATKDTNISFRILGYPVFLYGNRISMDIVKNVGTSDQTVYTSPVESTLALSIRVSAMAAVELKFRLMVNAGSTALPYEPYKPAQKLIIPTPGGLPGIPVSSGGNYTDEKSQQWVADEIDLAKGERVQRIGEYGFTGAEVWNSWGVNKYTEGITGFYWYFKNTLSIAQKRILNTHAVFSDNAWGGREEGTVAVTDLNDKYITWSVRNEYLEDISDNNVAIESFKKMLGEINAKMLYCLAEPIRTPLPPETIAAYKALRTYSPTTTVANDAGAGMSVGYAKMK